MPFQAARNDQIHKCYLYSTIKKEKLTLNEKSEEKWIPYLIWKTKGHEWGKPESTFVSCKNQTFVHLFVLCSCFWGVVRQNIVASGGSCLLFRRHSSCLRWPIKCWNVVKSSQFNGQEKLFLKCVVYMTCSPFTKVTQVWGCCYHDT
jgi:hypothetical protein